MIKPDERTETTCSLAGFCFLFANFYLLSFPISKRVWSFLLNAKTYQNQFDKKFEQRYLKIDAQLDQLVMNRKKIKSRYSLGNLYCQFKFLWIKYSLYRANFDYYQYLKANGGQPEMIEYMSRVIKNGLF